jgi:hypothetical protein
LGELGLATAALPNIAKTANEEKRDVEKEKNPKKGNEQSRWCFANT